MASFTRRNAWNNGGTFANPDLLWYARGVGVMQSRPLRDPNSWWFFAAIHGQYLTVPGIIGYPDWRFITAPPQVETAPLPSQQLQQLYWDQCQHQSWYFAPWHRGYLIALEAQIRAAVVSLVGPGDWALPYWNYFGPDVQNTIPPAFTEQTLPDGTTPNPLFVRARHGPRWDNVISVSAAANEACQGNTVYTGANAVTNPPGYGGPNTGFSHSNASNGNLEINPHNQVHGDVGGAETQLMFRIGLTFVGELETGTLSVGLRNTFQANGFALTPQARVTIVQAGRVWRINDVGQDYYLLIDAALMMLNVIDLRPGLMSDPGTAALDPIFYLHHTNIDRMWAAWNTTPSNSNPTDPNWLKGPAAVGERKFAMPMPDGSSWVYTPADVNSLSQLDYTYEDLPVTVSPQPALILAQRLMTLGVAPAAARAAQGGNMGGGENAELLGANEDEGALPISSSGARATVTLDHEVRGEVFASLAAASETNLPDRVYLRLENVRGAIDAYTLDVSVNQQHVGTVPLFGLRGASLEDGQHGGAGLTFDFDITAIIDNLFLANALDVNSLDVRIEPNQAFVELAQISIGRISVYRQGMQG